jgi:integrase
MTERSLTSPGSVEHARNGRWRVRMRLVGVGRKTIDTFATREEAVAYRATMADILQDEEPSAGVALADFGETVLTQRELSGHISDPGTDWSRWRNHIGSDSLASMPVKSVRDVHVEDWLDRLNAKGLSRQTRLHCLNLLRVVFRRAKKKRLIKENPCADIRLEVEKRTEEPWTFATPEEQDAIIAATPKPLDAIVEFAMGTGLRAGELVSLRLADVHLEGPDPYVTVRYGRPPAKPTKWGRIRQVPLFGRGMAGLRRWLDALPTYATENPKGLVFPAQRGGFRNHDHVLRWSNWKGSPARGKPGDRNYHAPTSGVLERAGITRHFRWHDLRHTCASSLVSGWWGRTWTLKEVCDLLGHRSITTTERYAHLADTALKQAARETHRASPLPCPTAAPSARNDTVTRSVPKPKVAGSRPVSRSTLIQRIQLVADRLVPRCRQVAVSFAVVE